LSKTKTASVTELRTQAEALGVDVPAKATKAQITALIAKQEQGGASANSDANDSPPDTTAKAKPAAKAPAPKEDPAPKEAKAKEERRKIETTTDRGDWTDPFSGLVVATGNEVNPRNGVRRDGDEAVLTTYA
jgi:hypothetical protein